MEIKKMVNLEEIIEFSSEMIKRASYPGVENQETEVANYIKEVFLKEGIECEIKQVQDGRANVIAILKGNGNGKKVLLTGHTDTVDPYGMKTPFEPKIIDNCLYGRGAVDMKGPLACMMGAMIAIKRSNTQLNGDVIFAGVIDEEYNSLGTIDLLENGINADVAIVGEPTNLEIGLAHRGLEWFEFEFIGKTVHGGKQKEGISAISKAVDFINELERDLIPKINSRKHPIAQESTLNYGYIQGGTQPSTVAGECVLRVDRRWIPGENYTDILREFQNVIDKLKANDPKFNCNMKVMDVSVMKKGYVHEAMEIDVNHEIIPIVESAVKISTGNEAIKSFFPAWTDGGLISTRGKIPAIIFGPGNLESAHSDNEHITLEQLEYGYLCYTEICLKYCK